jgi:hypothetical protein
MNLLRSFQQAIHRLVFLYRPLPIDIAAGGQTLDPLANAITVILLVALREGASVIRFVPNERNLRVLALVNGAFEELLFPLLKTTARPIGRILEQTLRSIPSQRDREATAEDTIYVGVNPSPSRGKTILGRCRRHGTIYIDGKPLQLRLFSIPTEHGDLLTIVIVDPGLATVSTAAAGKPTALPTPPSSLEERRRECRLLVDPSVFDTSDG